MSKLYELQREIDDAEEVLTDAQNRMHEYLEPIIKAHEGIDRLPGGFRSLWTYDGRAHIRLEWSGSGGTYDYEYHIPLSVFEKADADAIEAARQARERREAEKQAKVRAKEEAEFERLRVKLGK